MVIKIIYNIYLYRMHKTLLNISLNSPQKKFNLLELMYIINMKNHKQLKHVLKLDHIKPIRIYNLNINKSNSKNKNIIEFEDKIQNIISNNQINLSLLNIHNKKKKNLKISKSKNLNLSNKLEIVNNVVDLRSKFLPAYDQGDIGSCTANAICALVNFHKNILKGSRLFLYYNERLIESPIDNDSISDDDGASLSTGMASLITYGLCQEDKWPYIEKNFAIKPPQICYQLAMNNIALNIGNINNDINSIKNALNNNCPFVVGINLYSNFESDYVKKTGIVSMPNANETLLGGHAVVCVGYDDNKKVWIMRNSWGINWGDKGYFYLPYEYLTNSNLASDLWCLYKFN